MKQIKVGIMKNLNETLIEFAKSGNYEMVLLCLENGADVQADDNYALNWSANNGHLDVCRLLIEHGANIESAINSRYINEKGINLLRSLK